MIGDDYGQINANNWQATTVIQQMLESGAAILWRMQFNNQYPKEGRVAQQGVVDGQLGGVVTEDQLLPLLSHLLS